MSLSPRIVPSSPSPIAARPCLRVQGGLEQDRSIGGRSVGLAVVRSGLDACINAPLLALPASRASRESSRDIAGGGGGGGDEASSGNVGRCFALRC